MNKLERNIVHDPDYDTRPIKKSSDLETPRLMDKLVPLSQRLLSALIVDDGSQTVDFIAEFEDLLVQFSSPNCSASLDDRILIELQSIGLLLEAEDGFESHNSSHTSGASKTGNIANSKKIEDRGPNVGNCIENIGSETAAITLTDYQSPQLGFRAVTKSASGASHELNDKQTMVGFSSLGTGLGCIKDNSPGGVQLKKTRGKRKMKTKAKEKTYQMSSSGTDLGSMTETLTSLFPSKEESGETVGLNKNAEFVRPQDLSEETVDNYFGLAESDIADILEKPEQDIGSWFTVEGLSFEEPFDEAPLATPVDELTSLDLYFLS